MPKHPVENLRATLASINPTVKNKFLTKHDKSIEIYYCCTDYVCTKTDNVVETVDSIKQTRTKRLWTTFLSRDCKYNVFILQTVYSNSFDASHKYNFSSFVNVSCFRRLCFCLLRRWSFLAVINQNKDLFVLFVNCLFVLFIIDLYSFFGSKLFPFALYFLQAVESKTPFSSSSLSSFHPSFGNHSIHYFISKASNLSQLSHDND